MGGEKKKEKREGAEEGARYLYASRSESWVLEPGVYCACTALLNKTEYPELPEWSPAI